MINYEPYSPQTCQFHCTGSALPVDGEKDAVDGLRLLYATEWRPCFACIVGFNPDLTCKPWDVERAVPLMSVLVGQIGQHDTSNLF